MAKSKNTKSQNNPDDTSILFMEEATEKNNEETASIENYISELQELEKNISSGNLTVSEQIDLLSKARLIAEKIKILLGNAKTEINIIED